MKTHLSIVTSFVKRSVGYDNDNETLQERT